MAILLSLHLLQNVTIVVLVAVAVTVGYSVTTTTTTKNLFPEAVRHHQHHEENSPMAMKWEGRCSWSNVLADDVISSGAEINGYLLIIYYLYIIHFIKKLYFTYCKRNKNIFLLRLAHSIEIDSRGTYKSRTQTSKCSNLNYRNKRHIILFYVILRRATNFIYEDKRDKNV